MNIGSRSDRISEHSPGERLAADLFMLSNQFSDMRQYQDAVCALTAKRCGLAQVQIVFGTKGLFRVVGDSTLGNNPDAKQDTVESEQISPLATSELLSECLDRSMPLLRGGDHHGTSCDYWLAELCTQSLPGLLLIATRPEQRTTESNHAEISAADWDSLAACVGEAVRSLRTRLNAEGQASRFQRMLKITQAWNQTRETESLLFDMAEAATELLDAERATIFLWDRPQQRLVGRPALGVEGGELVIPENAGVVGQVVQSGEPLRVDDDIASEQRQIHRDVDEELNFETRSLVCVPLFVDGKPIGAFEVLNKSTGSFSDADLLALQDLAEHASVAIANTQHVEKLASSRRQIADEAADKVRLIGKCRAIEQLRNTINRVAPTELALLILGENGTGKEVVAQLAHYHSHRRDQVLVAVNCAAITESLLESELFGHEKGAFTDAHQARPGKFEVADGGTLFLDEIGDMSLGGQAKLLRVLEEKVVVRVGGSTPIPVDTRVIAATNQNLAELVRSKKFREDLFFRLNVVSLNLPPLRERGEDILLLANFFLDEFSRRARRKLPSFTTAAKKRLLGHSWPGNVRELRNLMERMAYLSEGDRIDAEDLAFIMSPRESDAAHDSISLDLTLADATRQFQVDFISKKIESCGGNISETADKLGLHRSNLYRKMRQLEMNEGGDDDDDLA